ncbi:MAG: TolC family protein [Gemmatimonadota bacterium]
MFLCSSPRTGSASRPSSGGARAAGRLLLILALPWLVVAPATVAAQDRVLNLTLERMVDLGLDDSYGIRRLQLDIERTRSLLRAEQSSLKSRVEMQLATPQFERISDYKWNSELQKDELVHENTRRWEMDLSVRQPVILFGYPTNGTLSLNNRVYRYSQIGEDERDVRYYNRYFIEYEQPLFQPNQMQNDLEGAELDLERSELEFQEDFIQMVHALAEDYFELLEAAYEGVIAAGRVEDLEQATAAADSLQSTDPARALDHDQLQVALANAREERQQAASSYRLQAENLKQRLRLPPNDSVAVDPVLLVEPVQVDVVRAIELAVSLAPRLRRVAIDLRESEISLEQTRGRDSFRMDVGLTYGREMEDPRFGNVWQEPRNSYTINVDASIPIWDWGERRHRIQAQQYSKQRAELGAEDTREQIETSVRSEIRNLEEYEQRGINMRANLELAQQITASTLRRYRDGGVNLVDVLQTIEREADTAQNFLDAYLGYRNALLDLERLTFYDFQSQQPLLDRYDIETYMTLQP